MAVEPRQMANAIRALAMDAVQAANSGHPGMPMGMADAATVLFTEFLKFDPSQPKWPDRDRFVLSAGHGSMLIYALLHLTGYERPTLEDIRNFRQLTSPCAGHPENFLLEGVECTTGPLGQGVAMAVGMALAERHLNAQFGDNLVDHRIWVIAGDGCLMEGINHEAVGLAGRLQLGKLNVIWDDNRITIDGATDLSTCEDIEARHAAAGWHTVRCDGHDFESIRAALREAADDPRPSLIACRTIIGWGAPTKAGTSGTHGSPLGDEEIAGTRKALAWTSEPFELADEMVDAWRAAGRRGVAVREAWEARAAAAPAGKALAERLAGLDPAAVAAAADALVGELLAEPKPMATRAASERALKAFTAKFPALIGGSADLTPSNNTKTPSTDELRPESYGGRYIRYGIREFGMSAAMNGMALHGGVVPYGGTFLVFSDYARPAIRLAALQNAQTIFVMTHDSIGVGEDGPTHQPIEHLQSLRMIPKLAVFRPCDAVETAECWALALQRTDGPSLLALSRQSLVALRNDAGMKSAGGGYVLRRESGSHQVTLIATGSEVEIAVGVAEKLEAEGVGSRVVSMPATHLFDGLPMAERNAVLGEAGVLRASIEAGVTLGWQKYTGCDGLNFGLDRFGASAPASDLYQHFGLTAEAIAPRIMAALQARKDQAQ